MARRPSASPNRIARGRPNELSGSRFRGALLGASSAGPGADAPAFLLGQSAGRTKVLHNPFLTSFDTFDSADAEALVVGFGVFAPIKKVLIGAGTGSTFVVNTPTSGVAAPYFLQPTGSNTPGSVVNVGAQWTQSVDGTDTALFSGIPAGAGNRAYDPAMVVSFVTEVGILATAVNNCSFGIGLLCAGTGANLSTTGTNVAATPGVYFRIPQAPGGTGGVSSPIQCIYNGGDSPAGGSNLSTATTTFTQSATVPIKYGIRIVLRGVVEGTDPILSNNSFIEFWINDQMVHRVVGNGTTTLVPENISPGLVSVLLAATAPDSIRIPYWTYSIGPVRGGASTA